MIKLRKHKDAPTKLVMLRRLFVALSFIAVLALGAISAATPATAQSGPICSKFDSGLDGWGPCSWAPNITTTTTTTGGIDKDNPYLQVTDLSGASALCSNDSKYLGNWVEKMGGCGQMCFDFKVFSSGIPPSAVTPSFSIYSGASRATFYASFQVAIGDTSWHRNICAPIMLGASAPPSPNGHWVITGGGTWNSIITNVTMMSLPIDFSSSPSEVVGYDNICMSPGGCGELPKTEISGCLQDSKIEVKCNPDGTYTLTLTSAGLAGDVISLISQTPGVSVAPPQQPWAATTTWTLSGATPGQLIALSANVSKVGGGSAAGTDQCCSGEIKVVMPECQKKPPIDLKVEKENTPAGGQGNGFNVWVTNVGAPITFAPGELTVDDVIPAGLNILTQSSLNWTCIPVPATGPATIHCTYNLAGTLGTGGQLTDSLVFTGVVTNHEKPLENCAIVSIPATVGVDTNPSNDKACVTVTPTEVGTLAVTKVVAPDPLGIGNSLTFPVTVTCTNPATSYPLNVHGNTSTVPNSLPIGSKCSILETLPPPPPGCSWLAPVYSPATVIIGAGVGVLTVTNAYECKTPGGPVGVVCDPRTTTRKGDICACRFDNMVRVSTGACGCTAGANFVEGRGCVTSLVCRPPLIPDAAGKVCICGPGLVQRGQSCVLPTVCNLPARLNSRGNCECPTNMVATRNGCAPRERRDPSINPDGRERRDQSITPGDILRNIPDGVFGPGGGGRDNPGGPRSGGGGPTGFPGR